MTRDTINLIGEFVAKVGVPAAICFFMLWQLKPTLDDLVKANNYATWIMTELRKDSSEDHTRLLRYVAGCCPCPVAVPPEIDHADRHP